LAAICTFTEALQGSQVLQLALLPYSGDSLIKSLFNIVQPHLDQSIRCQQIAYHGIFVNAIEINAKPFSRSCSSLVQQLYSSALDQSCLLELQQTEHAGIDTYLAILDRHQAIRYDS
jgi:hypothetical protein